MKYEVKGEAKFQVVILVEADDEHDAAVQAAEIMEVNVCVHGSKLADGLHSSEHWVLEDGCAISQVDVWEANPIEDEEEE